MVRKTLFFITLLIITPVIFSLGLFVGRQSIKGKLDYVKKQELELLQSKQGLKGYSILESLVKVDKGLEKVVKELPFRFVSYKEREKKYLAERKKLVDESEKMLNKAEELKGQFLEQKDLQAKATIGSEIINKMVRIGKINSDIREIDEKRFSNVYKYTNFLYTEMKNLLLAYGYEENISGKGETKNEVK